ncbi:MAG: hypothetical protein IKZ98_02340 [Clostridia bacterium]|nr:hypothetical protein [Clostridia bacterium]
MKKITAFMLCLFLVLSVLATSLAGEVTAAEEEEFIVPKVVPAKGIEDFVGEWMFYLIIQPDGTKLTQEMMLASGDLDDHANLVITENEALLYAPSADETKPVKLEFVAEDGSLKLIDEETDSAAFFFLTDNGMLVFFEPNVDNREATMYLSRKE